MQEILWMAGCVSVMAIFGIIAFVGYRKSRHRQANSDNQEPQ